MAPAPSSPRTRKRPISAPRISEASAPGRAAGWTLRVASGSIRRWYQLRSLVAQRDDRIEARGAVRGIQTEADADRGRHADREQHDGRLHQQREAELRLHVFAGADAGGD